MNDKTDSNDDLIPSIKPAQDEVASFRRSGRSEAPKQSNFNGVLVFVIVLMAIMMGVGGYALWEVQQKLEESNQLLATGQENMRDLEARLDETGDVTSNRFSDMESQVKTNVSEIDKLWGVSYRTNRPNIGQNTKAIEEIGGKLDKELKQLTTSMNKVNSDFQKFSGDMGNLRQQLLSDNEEMVTQVSLVRGQIQDQSVKVEANRRELAAMAKKMSDVNESIATFDRYRQQVNQRLIELQNQVQSQSAPAPGP